MFTSFQNALLSLLVKNRLLNRCKKHLTCFTQLNYVIFVSQLRKFFHICFRVTVEENDLCLPIVDIIGQDAF